MIALPNFCGENNLPNLVRMLSEGHSRSEILLNFSEIRFYTQGPLVALITQIRKWRSEGKLITLVGVDAAPAYRYLQRMDFFLQCGIELPEDFDRHDNSERFVTITPIPPSEFEVEQVASKIADCISPWVDAESAESEAWNIVVYCFTEMANNAIQHSGGHAFAAAQFIQKRNLVRAAIGDNGMGIRGSFLNAGFGETWNDLEAIRRALQYRVSSKGSDVAGLIGEPRNAGVGLTILRELLRLSGGSLTLLSGNGFYRLLQNGREIERDLDGNFSGTICCVEFKRGRTATIDQVITSLETDLL